MFDKIKPSEADIPLSLDELRWKEGENISVTWLVERVKRMWAHLAFAPIHLQRGRVQSVFTGENVSMLDDTSKWDFVTVAWKIVKNDQVQWWVEIKAESIEQISKNDSNNSSMQFWREMKENLDTILNGRIESLRNAEQKAIFTLSHAISGAFKDFCTKEGFIEIHTPKIVAKWAEGGANVFKLDYFWREASLAQSPQFYKQFMVPVFHRVFEVAPAFRAEQHATSRHINEYTSLDIEMWPIQNFREIMEMETKLIQFIIEKLSADFSEELELLKVELPEIWDGIPEITFDAAKKLVSQRFNRLITDMDDMEPEEERLLAQIVKEETGSRFVFITHFPSKKRPFYTMPNWEFPEKTDSFDLLFDGLEITTWGQRIHWYDEQVRAMIEKGLDPKEFNDFLSLHKSWTLPHWGFGIWSERLLQKIVGKSNIKATTLFPRDTKRLTP
jgi:nondiscriminating aspartyl-tRNA synthetase